MDKKLKKDITKQLEFLAMVYDQASKDRNSKPRAQKKAAKEYSKVKNILDRLSSY